MKVIISFLLAVTCSLLIVKNAAATSSNLDFKRNVSELENDWMSAPTASISGTTSICAGNTADITFNGTPDATVTYKINGGADQTLTLDNSGTYLLTSAILNSNTTFSLVSVTSSGPSPQTATVSGSAIVTVVQIPTATISGTVSICAGTGTTVSFTGTPNTTITYAIFGGSNVLISLDVAGNASINTGVLNLSRTYTLASISTIGSPACSQNLVGSAVITVIPLPTGAVTGSTTICSSSTSPLTFTGTPDATLTYKIDNGSNQTIVLDNTGNASLTSSALTANTTYTVSSAASATTPVCTKSLNSTATINVVALPTIAISGSTTICTGLTTPITFTGTPNASVNYTINGGGAQTINLNVAGTATLTSAPLTTNTVFSLISVERGSAPSCTQFISGNAMINVISTATASISGSTTLCSGSSTTIDFTGTPDATVYYTVNNGANQSIALNSSGVATVTSPTLTTTTSYDLVSVTNACSPPVSQSISGSAIVTILPLPTASVSGAVTLCSGSGTTINFTGTPDATVTYKINNGSDQTIVLDNMGLASVATGNLTATAVYTLVSIASATVPICTQNLNSSATVTVIPVLSATLSADTAVCSGATANVTFNGNADMVLTYKIDGGLEESVVLDQSGLGSIVTNALTSNATIDLVSIENQNIPSCIQLLSNSATIQVKSLPTVSISGTTTICSGTAANVTFTGTPNALVNYKINNGSAQTATISGGGTVQVSTGNLTADATFSLQDVALSTVPACLQTIAGSAVVTVNVLPTASISGTTTVCSGSTATIDFTGTPFATVTYTINAGSNQTIVLNGSGTASITTSALTVNTTYQLVSVVNSGNPSCTANLSGSAVITVNALPTAAVTSVAGVCSGADAVVNFTGTPNAVVTYKVNAGSNETITLDGNGIGTITTPDLTTTTTYTLVSVLGANLCSQLVTDDTQIAIYVATQSTTDTTSYVDFTWNGNTYTTSGTQTFTTTNQHGCDSTATLNLTVVDIAGTTQDGTLLTASFSNGTYQWMSYNGTYSPISGATSKSYTATSNGQYAVEVTYELLPGKRIVYKDTSALMTVSTASITSIESLHFGRVYPNPSSGQVVIELPNDYAGATVLVRNAIGQQVGELTAITGAKMNYQLPNEKGIYFIEISLNNGQKAIHKLLKE